MVTLKLTDELAAALARELAWARGFRVAQINTAPENDAFDAADAVSEIDRITELVMAQGVPRGIRV